MTIYTRYGRDVEQCVVNIQSTVEDIIDFLIPTTTDPLSEWCKKEVRGYKQFISDECSNVCSLHDATINERDDCKKNIEELEEKVEDLQSHVAELEARISELEDELVPWRLLNT